MSCTAGEGDLFLIFTSILN